MGLLLLIIEGIQIIVFIDVVLSWIMRDPRDFPRSITTRITAPLYAPFHAILDPSKTGGIDLAPLFLLLVLGLIARSL